MSQNNPYASYRATQTNTASQTQLIVMLHDGAIRFLAQAATAMSRKDYETKAINFGKAFAIIEHLWGTLDSEQGGEIAQNLEGIYSYMHRRLLEANLNDDFAPVKEVMKHLRSLREAWAQVDAETKANRVEIEQSYGGEELQAAA